MRQNATSAPILGHERPAATTAAAVAGIPIFEYATPTVKQSVVGQGVADKNQIQHMVKVLLRLPATPQEDSADAMAVALCHANTQAQLIKLAGARRFRRGRVV